MVQPRWPWGLGCATIDNTDWGFFLFFWGWLLVSLFPSLPPSSFLGSCFHDRVGIREFGRQDENDRNDSSAPQGSRISLNHPTQSNLLHGAWSHLEDTGMSMDGC